MLLTLRRRGSLPVPVDELVLFFLIHLAWGFEVFPCLSLRHVVSQIVVIPVISIKSERVVDFYRTAEFVRYLEVVGIKLNLVALLSFASRPIFAADQSQSFTGSVSISDSWVEARSSATQSCGGSVPAEREFERDGVQWEVGGVCEIL